MKRRAVLACMAAPLLFTACGFHLRGLGAAEQLAFSSIYVAAPPGGLGDDLRRQLSLREGLRLQPADQAEVVLMVDNEAIDKQILTVNRSGRVSEYQLSLRTSFSVRRGERDWIAPTPLQLRRDYSFDPNNVLGKEAEEQMLIRDMRNDAAQQIIRRLAALKPASAGDAAPAKP